MTFHDSSTAAARLPTTAGALAVTNSAETASIPVAHRGRGAHHTNQ